MIHPLLTLVLGCSGKGDSDDPSGDSSPSSNDSSTTTDTNPGFDCQDGLWLPGGYWDITPSLPTSDANGSLTSIDLALDATGGPVILSDVTGAGGEPLGIALRWRAEGDAWDVQTGGQYWDGFEEDGTRWRPDGRTIGMAGTDAWVGGRLTDGVRSRPLAVRIDTASGEVEPLVLDETVDDGVVVAGPAVTAEGTWWLGTVRDPAQGHSELVLWRVDPAGQVQVAHRATDLAPGDTVGRMVAGALVATSAGRVVAGAGSIQPDGTGRALLLVGDASGLSELSLPSEQTGGVPGSFSAARVQGDRLVYAWRAIPAPTPGAPSWQVYDGPADDPGAAVLIDEDSSEESARPLDLAIHQSGAVLVGGDWIRQEGDPEAPYIRLQHEGDWSITFAAPGTDPGWISSLEVEPSGEAWALCVFSADGLRASANELLHLECLL